MFCILLTVFIVDLWNIKYNYNYHCLSSYFILVMANVIIHPEGQKS